MSFCSVRLRVSAPQGESDFKRRAKFSADKGTPTLGAGAVGRGRGRGSIIPPARLPKIEGTPSPPHFTTPTATGLSLGGSLLGGSLTGVDARVRS